MSKNKKSESKISIWNEFNLVSGLGGAGLIALVIACIGMYIFMNLSPKKTVKVIDDADIFTRSEISELEDIAEDLSEDKDINIVIVTTRNKGRGYTNSDEDCQRYAENFYFDHIRGVPLQNNSGFCLLVDLTEDEPGRRFFWLYTYGTAHFAVDDDECYEIFYGHKDDLAHERYFDALEGIMDDLDDYSFKGYPEIVFFTMMIPVAGAWFVTHVVARGKKLDSKPGAERYANGVSAIGTNDIVTKTRVVHHTSSSSSGGGGFSGGGGGGGFSGGGGGRF